MLSNNMKKPNHVTGLRWAMMWVLWLIIPTSTHAAEDLIQMLCQYDLAKDKERVEQGNRVMDYLVRRDFGEEKIFTDSIPADSIDMTVWYYAAEYLYHQQRPDDCITYAEKALPLTDGNGDWTWRSETLNLLMLSHHQLADWSKALEYGEKLYDYEREHADSDRLSSTLNTLAGTFLAAHQPKQALEYALKALEENSKTKNLTRRSIILGVSSEIYQELEDYDQALSYSKEALAISQEQGDSARMGIHLLQMSATEIDLLQFDKARKHAEQAQPLLQKAGNWKSLGIGYNQLGLIAIKQQRHEEAANYFRQAENILRQIGDRYNQCNALHGLYDALYKTNPDEAKHYHDLFIQIQDSLYHSDVTKAMGNYHAHYRNSELSERNEQAKRTNHYILFTAVAVALLLLAAIAFLVYAVRLKTRSNRTLRDLQKARELFFTNITHEFRTPLTVILGTGQQLKKQNPQNKDIQMAASMIEQEGQQLLGLVNQLLDLSKLKAQSTPPAGIHGNIIAYLSMLLENYRSYAHTKGVELVFAPRENNIEMDFVPDYIQKIVRNLVSNAIKFTPANGHIFITTRQETNTEFVLTIADNGPGMSRQVQKHIFEPFYQGETDSENIGTGIGLSLVKQIVSTLKGRIEVCGSPGKGSIFIIHLPITHQANHQQAAITAPDGKTTDSQTTLVLPDAADSQTDDDEQATADQTATTRQRILIIEDNSNVALFMGNQLTENYEVYYAANGQVGIERAETLIPDLIITDLMMPEMDGLEVCRHVRANDAISHVPIIIITAKTTEEDRIRGIEAGADAYLYKPFNAEELTVRVSKLLEQRQHLREKFAQAMAEGSDHADDQLNETDREFLGKLTDLVYSLMGRGETDVETIASHLAMSGSVLRRKVVAITGQTPAAYIMQIRMSNAKRLLDAHPEWSISDVAMRCGFNDNTHFAHTFKKLYGVSPTQYAHRAK